MKQQLKTGNANAPLESEALKKSEAVDFVLVTIHEHPKGLSFFCVILSRNRRFLNECFNSHKPFAMPLISAKRSYIADIPWLSLVLVDELSLEKECQRGW